MALLAVRLIDLAIFGSLGGLWLGGAAFIVVLYRWILRFEREQEQQPVPIPGVELEPTAARARISPPAGAPEALPSHS